MTDINSRHDTNPYRLTKQGAMKVDTYKDGSYAFRCRGRGPASRECSPLLTSPTEE